MAPETVRSLLSLLIVFAAAKLGEELFVRLRQPALVGQILAGFLVGPGLLHWVSASPTLDFMAEIGVIFLLFATGLETQPEEVLEHGWLSFGVALLGVLTPLLVGWGFARSVGENPVTARFVGTMLVATSIGITAKVLADFGATATAFGRVILAAAVIDDILGLLALSMLASFASAPVHRANLLLTVGFVAGFFVLVLFLRRAAFPRFIHNLERLRAQSPLWSFALVVLLAFSVMSAYIGLAAIIGAFLAGMFVSESEEVAGPLRQQAAPVDESSRPGAGGRPHGDCRAHQAGGLRLGGAAAGAAQRAAGRAGHDSARRGGHRGRQPGIAHRRRAEHVLLGRHLDGGADLADRPAAAAPCPTPKPGAGTGRGAR